MLESENPSDDLKSSIRATVRSLGFDAVGFARTAGEPQDARNLAAYLAEGRHGDMGWMATTAERRADPRSLWPEAKTAIVLGLNYGPDVNPLALGNRSDRGAISVYAQGQDYHTVMKKRLKVLGRWLTANHGGEVKVFVDTAPIMEKPLAMRAGLGWIGKHTNLVSREFGSWLFLGEVLTTLDIAPDASETDRCGTCRRCMDACPTGALPEPYRIDPRRCISYLTIEHKQAIESDLQAKMGNRIYGCDDCLAVCPWNKFAVPTSHAALRSRPNLAEPTLAGLALLDDSNFRELFAGTAVKRTGRDRMLRNVAIALGNSARPSLNDIIKALATDSSELVRDSAHEALRDRQEQHLE
ncbi:MAG: tRNA epoxyqueuosine(34) reductase QueG [Rhodospirillales bacterium]|nr:tRNA epoxyqueuosine(34) reductase QueG [Rhodospirillales bacterium]